VVLLFATTVSSAWPTLLLTSLDPQGMQIGESSRDGSAPADKVQSSASSGLGYVDLPLVFLPLPPKPDVLPITWREIGAYQPGYPQRIDHPPRLGV
jgi:hypothetical protein